MSRRAHDAGSNAIMMPLWAIAIKKGPWALFDSYAGGIAENILWACFPSWGFAPGSLAGLIGCLVPKIACRSPKLAVFAA